MPPWRRCVTGLHARSTRHQNAFEAEYRLGRSDGVHGAVATVGDGPNRCTACRVARDAGRQLPSLYLSRRGRPGPGHPEGSVGFVAATHRHPGAVDGDRLVQGAGHHAPGRCGGAGHRVCHTGTPEDLRLFGALRNDQRTGLLRQEHQRLARRRVVARLHGRGQGRRRLYRLPERAGDQRTQGLSQL